MKRPASAILFAGAMLGVWSLIEYTPQTGWDAGALGVAVIVAAMLLVDMAIRAIETLIPE